ncbi:MAG: hypothetical protein R3F14_21485 [Polyangiaceae bacterium]
MVPTRLRGQPLPAIALPTGASPLDISAMTSITTVTSIVIGSATSGQSLPFHIYQGHGDGTFSKVPSPAPRNQSERPLQSTVSSSSISTQMACRTWPMSSP